MSKKFQRKIEDFVCENCGLAITGNGYTNHCPKCLWSKHVDINPGDRSSSCQSLMKPIKVEIEKGEYIIIHECIKCGYKKRNKKNNNDDMEIVFKINSLIL